MVIGALYSVVFVDVSVGALRCTMARRNWCEGTVCGRERKAGVVVYVQSVKGCGTHAAKSFASCVMMLVLTWPK